MEILSGLHKVGEDQDAQRQRHHRQIPKAPDQTVQEHHDQDIAAIRPDHRIVHTGADKDFDPDQE